MKAGGALRRQLTVIVVAVVGASLGALSVTLHVTLTNLIRDRFDERLAQEAQAISFMASAAGPRGAPLGSGSLASLDQTRGPTTYEVWADDGALFARFPPEAAELSRLPQGAAPRFANLVLPNGRRGRLYQAWLPAGPRGARRIAVAVARDTEQLDRRIATVRAMVWGPTLGSVALAAVLVFLAIRRSLRGVTALSARIESIDASSVGNRLELAGVPDELRPPFAKINGMLARFEESLARERQFSADVSHELRTPLAALRNILEVSMSRDRPAASYRSSLGDALEVVQQLERTVEVLLLLVRIGSGQMKGNRHDEVRLRELVDSCFAPHGATARSRRVRFENRIGSELSVTSDGSKLSIIAANLLANAAEYTAEGGWIAVESDPARGLVLAVRDSGPAIPEHELRRLFDPFFRLDRSRSGGGQHLGIGLTLVRGLCETLGYQVTAGNEAEGTVRFTVATAATSHPLSSGAQLD